MKVEPFESGLRYSEGESSSPKYWLDSHDTGLYFYHTCKKGAPTNILTDGEVMRNKCYCCGKMDLPENLRAMYILYHFDTIQREDHS